MPCILKCGSVNELNDMGSKAKNIFILQDKGIKTPKSWYISYTVLMKELEKFVMDEGLVNVGALSFSTLSNFFDNLPQSLYLQLNNDVANLLQTNSFIKSYAIRSSGCEEDGENYSFAGQFISFLNIRKAGNITLAIINCWRACFGKDLNAYMNINNFKNIDPCSILVQEYIHSKCAGVLFKSKGNYYISATWGAAKSVVDGTSITDNWKIDKNNNVTAIINKKNYAYIGATAKVNPLKGDKIKCVDFPEQPFAVVEACKNTSNALKVWIPDELTEQPCLTDSEVENLVCTSQKTAELIGVDNYDIEWCINGQGELYILQIRPITRAINEEIEINYNRNDKYQGMGLVEGTAAGHLCFVENEKQALSFKDGDILCAKRLIGPVLHAAQKAAGCIVESDSILSHSAIIARELGIPAIGVSDINLLSFGRFVRIDGKSGRMENCPETDEVVGEKINIEEIYNKEIKSKILDLDSKYFDFECDGIRIEREL